MKAHYYPAAMLAATTMALSAYAQTTAAPAAPARVTPPASARAAPPTTAALPPATPALRPCSSVVVDPPTHLTLGKSRVVRLDFPVARLIVGGQASSRAGRPVPTGATALAEGGAVPPQRAPQQPRAASQENEGVADTEITLLSPTELFFLGKKTGSMNVVLQSNDGRCVVKDIIVTIDPDTLQAKLSELMPEETGIKVRGADTSLVLTGNVSDLVKLDQVMHLATSYGEAKVVNLLRVTAPQQVMLEVKIAEVSKNLLDKLGSSVNLTRSASGGQNTYSLISNFLSGGGGLAQALRIGRGTLNIDGEINDGLVRVLAEPNIVAISGQSASFLSGGKIFIPVAQTPSPVTGFTTITLEEKEFGVGLKFTPTVLDGGRVNLKLVSEASELSQSGSPFSTLNGVTAILPSMTTRRIDTTVQLGDGQSFVVAGLIKNNINQAVNKFPGLGEVPVMGALFRSTEFQTDQTELMFVVTPRLVKPLTSAVMLPTDNHAVPARGKVMLMGAGEGAALPPARSSAADAAPVATPTPVTAPAPRATAPAPANTAPAPAVKAPAASPAQTPVSDAKDAAAPPAPPEASPQPVRVSAIKGTPIRSLTPATPEKP